MKKIVVLGSTGSIGISTMDIARAHSDRLEITALSAGDNWKLLAEQVVEFKPKYAVLANAKYGNKLREACSGTDTEIMTGAEALCDIAALDEIHTVVTGISGAAGLLPTIRAIEHSKTIALANKEPLVMAGELITQLARKHNATILPVDSEHSAVFQCLQGAPAKRVSKIYLTASGGPFFGKSQDELSSISVAQALNHPTWNMGKKITIDSATLMNKALEIVEAHWLFGLSSEQIDVVIHPQSIVHSMVQFSDNSVLAQLGVPDMKIPIQYALSFPDRWGAAVESPDLCSLGSLDFRAPDHCVFPSLDFGHKVVQKGGMSGVILNAANEVAVERFLKEEISFLQIFTLIDNMMQMEYKGEHTDLNAIITFDTNVREQAYIWKPSY